MSRYAQRMIKNAQRESCETWERKKGIPYRGNGMNKRKTWTL